MITALAVITVLLCASDLKRDCPASRAIRAYKLDWNPEMRQRRTTLKGDPMFQILLDLLIHVLANEDVTPQATPVHEYGG